MATAGGSSPKRGARSGRARRSPTGLGLAVALLLATTMVPTSGHAQLLSPGPLTDPHAELEGLRNCTSCHRLGSKGAANDRCLSCHVTIEARIKADRGYHASLDGQSCAECHKEHLGRDFALVRMDTATFDHSHTGYRLEGAHREARCGECHSEERIKASDVKAWGREHGSLGKTLLGLDRSCRGCHAVDDPHGGQFTTRECETCHATIDWQRAERFDHDRAGYRLTGEHRRASCQGCHPAEKDGGQLVVRYTGARVGNCSSCHADEHRGAMGGDCQSCHDPSGWGSLDQSRVASRFDHGRTRFALIGKHAEANCETCHARRRRSGDPVQIRLVTGTERSSYPKPRAGSCGDCHVDAHAGDLADRPDGGTCESCHGEYGWTPASFGVDRHNEETAFPLTGAHVVTFCSACHGDGGAPGNGGNLRFAIDGQHCISCHRDDDPHEGSFGDRACETCHVTRSFEAATFDHVAVGTLACRSCHEPDDPHAGQFGDAVCAQCHGTTTFAIPDFDHNSTRFKLDGGHAGVACSACHVPDTDGVRSGSIRYRPVPTECSACHGSAR